MHCIARRLSLFFVVLLLGPNLGSEADQFSVVTTLTDSGDVLEMVKSVIPRLERGKHKGQDGRLATIGGCKEYTGAPYFAAMAALKTVSCHSLAVVLLSVITASTHDRSVNTQHQHIKKKRIQVNKKQCLTI